MNTEGPTLEALIHHLTDIPADFLAEPRIGSSGQVHVAAVVHDLGQLLGHAFTADELDTLAGSRDRNLLSVVLLLCWLLSAPWLSQQRLDRAALLALLRDGARELAGSTASRKFVRDAERREELVRLSLSRLGYRPRGESPAQAEDRLTSLSAVERARVVRAAKEAEARARRIREELARKAAEESADKWSRE